METVHHQGDIPLAEAVVITLDRRLQAIEDALRWIGEELALTRRTRLDDFDGPPILIVHDEDEFTYPEEV